MLVVSSTTRRVDLPTLQQDSGVQALEQEWQEQRQFNYPLRNSSNDPTWQAFADDMKSALDALAHPTAPTMVGQDGPGTPYRCQGIDYSFGDDGTLRHLQDTYGTAALYLRWACPALF